MLDGAAARAHFEVEFILSRLTSLLPRFINITNIEPKGRFSSTELRWTVQMTAAHRDSRFEWASEFTVDYQQIPDGFERTYESMTLLITVGGDDVPLDDSEQEIDALLELVDYGYLGLRDAVAADETSETFHSWRRERARAKVANALKMT